MAKENVLETLEKLNPCIKKIEIGIKKLRTITIYPLSAGHQLQLVGSISDIAESFSSIDITKQENIISLLRETIQKHLQEFLSLVTDPDETVTMFEIDNSQLADLIDIIYEQNFGSSLKKFQQVWEKTKTVFRFQTSSQK